MPPRIPAMRRLPAWLFLVALLGGCTGSSHTLESRSILRAAEDAPDEFLVGFPNSTATETPSPGGACRNPMVDPRDGTRLTLIRSSNGRGEYEAAGRYGLAAGELLRLDCGTGSPLGIVRR